MLAASQEELEGVLGSPPRPPRRLLAATQAWPGIVHCGLVPFATVTRLVLGVLALALAATAAAATPGVTRLRVGSAPYRLAVSDRSLWASVNGSATVVRLNPSRGRIN